MQIENKDMEFLKHDTLYLIHYVNIVS